MDHILSAQQFSPDILMEVFDRADYLGDKLNKSEPIESPQPHGRNGVATVFYEPSTRTRLSFEAAASYIHLPYISTENAKEFSSAVKGELIEDTVLTIGKYAGAIVMRHGEVGALQRAAAVSEVPLINAGDGGGEHPTQAILDAYTIWKEKGRLDNLNVVLGGDLKKGRTARSLAILLSKFDNNHITGLSLPQLSLGNDIKAHLAETNTGYYETTDMHEAIAGKDVIYWTRLQLERHKKEMSFIRRCLLKVRFKKQEVSLADNFILDDESLKNIDGNAIIMHPLPRNNEIARSVDKDPRAKYFDQVENGVHVRMALLDMLFRNELQLSRPALREEVLALST